MGSGQRWVITGASSGIGRALAAVVSRSGGEVIGWDVADPPTGMTSVKVDLADDDSICRAAAQIDGPVHCFAHCAGINPPSSIANGSPHVELRKCMRVNAESFLLAVSLLIDQIAAVQGSIVTVTSVAQSLTSTSSLGYGASKAALRRIVEHLATELGPRGIRVNAVAPGPTRTAMTESVWRDSELAQRRIGSIPLGRPGEATEIAAALYFLGSQQSSYISGACIPVDGGLTAGVGTVALG